jgi:SOS-response transcriptional repressor LexA
MHATHVRMYNFIRQWQEMHPYPCTIRELMEGTGIKSSSSVVYGAIKLREAGLVEFTENEARTLVLAGSTYNLPPRPAGV